MFHLILGKITFHPITFPPIYVSPNSTFHPNNVSLKLCFRQTTLMKEFHAIFFSSKTYIADELWFPIITQKPTDLPQILIGKDMRIVGMFLDWLKNLIWVGQLINTNILMQIVVNPQLFCSKSAKPHFIWPWRHSCMKLSTSPQKGGCPF